MYSNQKKRLKINIITTLIFQTVNIVSGFVLPNYILKYYGSSVNGLLSSIMQFLSLITLCDCGVGAVVQSALYKPIAENDEKEISRIYIASKKFFDKISIVLMLYVLLLIGMFPAIIHSSFSWDYVAILIVAMSISIFAQYYFAITYKMILGAAQLIYIQMIISICTVLINMFFSVVMMKKGFSIQSVKSIGAIIFLLQPLGYKLAIERKYKIDKKIKIIDDPIKQKWNGFAQHVAMVVLENTDIMLLTIFSTLHNVSIYSVYHLVTNGIKLIFTTVCNNIKPIFGEMIAKKEYILLNDMFSKIEWLMHCAAIFFYAVATVLIVPFVSVYTKDIDDTNYIVPRFAILMCVAMAFYVIRLPYSQVVMAAGHFKQTQASAIVEAIINLVLSVFLIRKFGLIGVAIGTLIAILYRTVYYVFYLKDNILNRKVGEFGRLILIDICSFIIINFICKNITMVSVDYGAWLIMALKVTSIAFVVMLLVNMLVNKKYVAWLLKYILKKDYSKERKIWKK